MINHRYDPRILIAPALGIVWLLIGASCAPQFPLPLPLGATAVSTPSTSATQAASVTPSRPPATAESQPDTISTPEATGPIRLSVWTVEAVSAQADEEAGEVFGRGLQAFQEAYPDIELAVVTKNESGKGSVPDYLRTASQVAPDILPDVVVVNTTDLASLARAGLIVPLDGLISSSLAKDLLPGAERAGRVDGQLVGIPFEMEVQHLIYNTNKLSSAPLDWSDVISANTTYVFPAKGKNGLVNDAFLIQYLALEGRLQDDEGRPFLDEQVLQTVLQFYRQGLDEGVIPEDVLAIGDPDDVWPSYVAAEVGMSHVTSHRFLQDRNLLRTTLFTTIPTRDGTPLTIGRGRALAIVARDPSRQVMASRLIEWLMAPENNAAWNQATAQIPTRYAVFELIGEDDPYWPFLEDQLEVAVGSPAFPEYDQIGRVLQQAVVEVLSGESTPEEAARAAVEVVVP